MIERERDMAFSDFDLKTACERFDLRLEEGRDLYSTTSSTEVPPRLREILDEWAPAAVAMNTEKARSEMIVAPVLMTATRLAKPPVNLFSGVAFNVDEQRGLNGACDYLLTRSTERFFIRHPVAAIVEAKREDIAGGLGQCVAEMVAARIYNEREGSPNLTIHGVVTTGSIWRFLRLEDNLVTIDRPEYYLTQIGQILTILVSLFGDNV
jgi:hypothetical protein